MYGKFKDFLAQELDNIKAAGLYKNETVSYTHLTLPTIA